MLYLAIKILKDDNIIFKNGKDIFKLKKSKIDLRKIIRFT